MIGVFAVYVDCYMCCFVFGLLVSLCRLLVSGFEFTFGLGFGGL